jgi:ABC-type phosphate transport system substrate-binding protein
MASTDPRKASADSFSDLASYCDVGEDAIVPIVSSDISVKGFSPEQLRNILNGSDKRYHLFWRRNSGTTDEVKHYLGIPHEQILAGEVVGSNEEVLRRVASTTGGFGYVSYSFLATHPEVHAVPVLQDNVVNQIPTPSSIAHRRCALVRHVRLYFRPFDDFSVNNSSLRIAKAIFENFGDSVGQNIAIQSGFLPEPYLRQYQNPTHPGPSTVSPGLDRRTMRREPPLSAHNQDKTRFSTLPPVPAYVAVNGPFVNDLSGWAGSTLP